MLRKSFIALNHISALKNVVKNVSNKNEFYLDSRNSGFVFPVCVGFLRATPSRSFHSSLPRSKREDRREMLASMPAPDEGTEGERSVDVDTLVQSARDIYPDKNTFTTMFDGIQFSKLPICNIQVTKNNTTFSIADHEGKVKILRSSGIEGFKKARKGTNVAAQATAITIGTKAYERGIKAIRVRVKGLGPGRMSAIKGLQMSGLNIISVTDNTPISWNPPRPKKQRKL